MYSDLKKTLNGISQVQNLFSCLNFRKSVDENEFEVFSLHNSLHGKGDSLQSAFSSFSEKALLFSLSREPDEKQNESCVDSNWLHSSLGTMLRIRHNESVDFNYYEEDPESAGLRNSSNLRWETEEEGKADKEAFDRLLTDVEAGKLVIGPKAGHSYMLSSVELTKAYILLWPQMAQLIEEEMLLCESENDFELYRIDLSYDPEDGQPKLNFYRDFFTEESQEKYYEKLRKIEYDPNWADNDNTRYITGPEGLNSVEAITSSPRGK